MVRETHRIQSHPKRFSKDLCGLMNSERTTGVPVISIVRKDIPMETTATRENNNSTMPNTSIASAVAATRLPGCHLMKQQSVSNPRIVRGSVWFADLGGRYHTSPVHSVLASTPTSVQSGVRPVLIISNDRNNRYGAIVTVIPFTGASKRLDMPTHVSVSAEDVRNGYRQSELYTSTLLCEQVTVLDKTRLVGYVGTVVNPDLMTRIETALLTQVGISQTRQE